MNASAPSPAATTQRAKATPEWYRDLELAEKIVRDAWTGDWRTTVAEACPTLDPSDYEALARLAGVLEREELEANAEFPAAARARDLIVFADGLEASGAEGMVAYARRARMVARDVLELDDQLAAERSVRLALQAKADRLEEIVGAGTYYGAIAQAAVDAQHDARATVIAKQHVTEPSGIELPS